MTLKEMLKEMIALGQSQTSLAAGMKGMPGAPTQGTISKIILINRDPSYMTGKTIETFYAQNIKRLRKTSASVKH